MASLEGHFSCIFVLVDKPKTVHQYNEAFLLHERRLDECVRCGNEKRSVLEEFGQETPDVMKKIRSYYEARLVLKTEMR